MTFTSGRTQVSDRLAMDENLSYAHVLSPEINAISASVATSAVVFAVSAQLPGGALGANGYIDIRVYGSYSITASSGGFGFFPTLSGGIPFGVATQAITTTGELTWEARAYLQNVNSETSQRKFSYLNLGSNATPLSPTPAVGYGPMRATADDNVDTSQDFIITAYIDRDGTDTGALKIFVTTLTTYYLA